MAQQLQAVGRLRTCSSGLHFPAMAQHRISVPGCAHPAGTAPRPAALLPCSRGLPSRRVRCRIAQPCSGTDCGDRSEVDLTSDPQNELAYAADSCSTAPPRLDAGELEAGFAKAALELQLQRSPSVNSTRGEQELLVGAGSSSSTSSSFAAYGGRDGNHYSSSSSRSASPSRSAVAERPAGSGLTVLAAVQPACSSSAVTDEQQWLSQDVMQASASGQLEGQQDSVSVQQQVHAYREKQQEEQEHKQLASGSDNNPGQPSAGQQQEQQRERGGIPHSIFIISMVSMALTSASCVFNTLLPIYMVTELRMSMQSMGMFEGVLEAFSYVVRMFSGVISDRMTSRKAAITLGFAMGALAKLGMSFATSVGQLFVGKAVDRLANGVQAAPRDALIGDLSPVATRSACFGFAQSMRKWGSFMGAGLAFALMKVSGNNYRLIFLLAAGVSALSCMAFALLVPSHANAGAGARKQQQQEQQAQQLRQQEEASTSDSPSSPLLQQQQQQQQQGRVAATLATAKQLWADVRCMGKDFWRVLSVIALYGLGHINESLLEARAIEVGFGKAESTLVVALLCFAVFLCAYPLGKLDDKYGHNVTFAVGMASLVAGDLVLLTSGTFPYAVFAACMFWGAHWAVVQGPMLSIVVGLSPPHLKGTAFGIFYTVMACTAMLANTVYGRVWHQVSANAAFGLSAAVISLTMLLLPVLLPQSARNKERAAAKAAAAQAAVAEAAAA